MFFWPWLMLYTEHLRLLEAYAVLSREHAAAVASRDHVLDLLEHVIAGEAVFIHPTLRSRQPWHS